MTVASAIAFADEETDESKSEPEGQLGASAPTLASYLADGSLHVSADVELSDDPEPVLGSFMADGLTYAVTGEGEVCLVAVAPSTLAGSLAGDSVGVEGTGRGIGSGWTTSPQPLPAPSAEADGSGEVAAGGSNGAGLARIAGSAAAALLAEGASEPAVLSLPGSVAFDGIGYSLTALGPRALAGCMADVVSIPASVASVDPTAMQGCAASSVEVGAGNPSLASYDGMLFSADLSSLLLIPEGKQGAARIPKEAEEVDPSLLSHSEGVSSVSVEAGSAAFTSRNGCLYDVSGRALLYAPDSSVAAQWETSGFSSARASEEGPTQLVVIRPTAIANFDSEKSPIYFEITKGGNYLSQNVSMEIFEVGTAGRKLWWWFWKEDLDTFRLWIQDSDSNNFGLIQIEGAVKARPGFSISDWRVLNTQTKVNREAHLIGDSQNYFEQIDRSPYDAARTNGLEVVVDPIEYHLKFDYGEGKDSLGESSSGTAPYTASDLPLNLPEAKPPAGKKLRGWRVEHTTGSDVPIGADLSRFPEYQSGSAMKLLWGDAEACSTLGDLTCTAVYDYETYKVRYLIDKGSLPEDACKEYRTNQLSKGLPKLSCPGYEFKGWYVRKDASSWEEGEEFVGDAFVRYRDGTSMVITSGSDYKTPTVGDIQCKPRWEPIAYSITYDRNGGVLEEHILSYTVEDLPFNLGKCENNGYEFATWDVELDRLNDTDDEDWSLSYAEGNPTKIEKGTVGNLICTAQWTAVTYTIAFKDGDELSKKELPYTRDSPDFALPSARDVGFDRPGHDFAGWDLTGMGVNSPDAVVSGLTTIIRKGTWGDILCEARWNPKVVTITLDSRDADRSGTEVIYQKFGVGWFFDSGATEPIDDLRISPPEWNAYDFKGYWYQGAAESIRITPSGYISSHAAAFTSDCTFFAKRDPKEYSIEYELVGGSLGEGGGLEVVGGYTVESEAFTLPIPQRYGYRFDGWKVEGAQGSGVETVTLDDGSKATRVKVGTYGNLTCTAKWALRYDLDVPVCDPGSVTFEADSLTGEVRVAAGSSGVGEVRSYMAVPVALDSLACVGLDVSGAADGSGGALALEALFGEGAGSKVRFTATFGEGGGAAARKLSAGDTASLSGLAIPAATSATAPGRLPVTYGLELDPDLAIPSVHDAVPVARLTYTVSLPQPDA